MSPRDPVRNNPPNARRNVGESHGRQTYRGPGEPKSARFFSNSHLVEQVQESACPPCHTLPPRRLRFGALLRTLSLNLPDASAPYPKDPRHAGQQSLGPPNPKAILRTREVDQVSRKAFQNARVASTSHSSSINLHCPEDSKSAGRSFEFREYSKR